MLPAFSRERNHGQAQERQLSRLQPPEPDPQRQPDRQHPDVEHHERHQPGTRTAPLDLAGQVTNIFKHIRLCVEAGGGTVDDIIKINFWMKQPSTGRAALNDEWVKMFPDEGSRPARHTLTLAADSAHLVTCDFTAVIG